MATVDKSIEIHAAADAIFAIVNDPQRMHEYIPGVNRVENVRQTDQHIGDGMQVVHSVLGIPMTQRFVVTGWVRDQHIDLDVEGSMPGTFAWTFQPHGDTTRVSVHVEYELRGGPLGKAVDTLLIERMNEKNMERTLENLQLISEGSRRG